MAFQAVPDTAEIVIEYIGNGTTLNNVLHATLVGGYTLADLTALGVAVDAAIAANWLPIQAVAFGYQKTTIRGLALENDQEVINNTNAGLGLSANAPPPSNATLSIKKASTQTGRSARGRLYWIGMTVNQLQTNENLFSFAAVTAITAAVEAMRVAITATAWTPVIVSRFTGGVKRPFGVTFFWANTIAVNDTVDSQRRRLLA